MSSKHFPPQEPRHDFYAAFAAFEHVMLHDCVLSIECGGAGNAHRYIEEFGYKSWQGQGYTIQFVEYLCMFLFSFGNPCVSLLVDHRQTPYYPDYTWGIRTRAFEDSLYVTQAREESGFSQGDEILFAGLYAEGSFKNIPSLREFFGTSLYGQSCERQLWDPLLHFADRYLISVDSREGASDRGSLSHETKLASGLSARVADAEKTRRIKAVRLPHIKPLPAFELSEHSSGCALLTLRDLSKEDEFSLFLRKNAAHIAEASTLLIDVRTCSGGDEFSAAGLLPYIISTPVPLASFMEETCLTNYSAGNVARQIESLEEQLRKDCPEEVQSSIEAWIDDLRGNKGKGLVEEEYGIPDEARQPLQPSGKARRVVVLTDVYTRDAAEVLAEACLQSERACTLGRPTRGARGFFNPCCCSSDCFTLVYPTSRFTDEGLQRRFSYRGVPAQEYIPWSPEAIEHDVDLEAALKLAF